MNSAEWRSYWQDNVAGVGGWLAEWEGRELYEHARQMAPNGPMAELGCYQGRTIDPVPRESDP